MSNGLARTGDAITGYITNYHYGSHVDETSQQTIEDYADVVITGVINDNSNSVKVNSKSVALVGDIVTVEGTYTDYQNNTQVLEMTGYIANGKSSFKVSGKEVAYLGCNINTNPQATSCYISTGSNNVFTN